MAHTKLKPVEHPCPECGAGINEPCKAPPPMPLTGVHAKRWEPSGPQKKKGREDVNQAAARIVREATKD